MKRYEGKVALLTGGANGIGKAIATRLVAEGARLVIGDNEEEPLKATCAELGDAVIGVPTDVRVKSQVEAMVDVAVQKFGALDVVFSNAGVCGYNLFLEETEENWAFNIDSNAKSMFLVGQAAAKAMIKLNRPGAIVNTASVACDIVSPTTASYAASKAAVMQLTRVMALELAKHNIRVNCFGPGPIKTRMSAKTRANPERTAMFLKKLAEPRFGEPEEVAALALFLGSDEASFVSGAIYYVDGGYRCQ